MRTVVITGIGMSTSMGASLAEARALLAEGRSAVKLDPSSSEKRPRATALVEEKLTDGMVPAFVKMVDRTTLLTLKAGDRLMADAGLASPDRYDPDRIGAFVGCSGGSVHSVYQVHDAMLQRDSVGSMSIMRVMPNGPASHLSIRYQLLGETGVTNLACASSAAAIGYGMRQIRHGYLDQAVCGGCEAPTSEAMLRSWEAMMVMARPEPGAPEQACRPFSADRAGVVLGEGAVLFLLESLEHAKARGARIYATVAGYGASSDGKHVSMPYQSGQTKAMRAALADARLGPADIGYINAHGTATPAGDIVETKATREVFGAAAEGLPISSTKGVHGHLLGAAGAIELLPVLMALQDGFIAPTVNLRTPDPECDLDYVPNVARQGPPVAAAMSNSFAFGGSNGCLVLARPDAGA